MFIQIYAGIKINSVIAWTNQCLLRKKRKILNTAQGNAFCQQHYINQTIKIGTQSVHVSAPM
jgi:hypothetical protein